VKKQAETAEGELRGKVNNFSAELAFLFALLNETACCCCRSAQFSLEAKDNPKNMKFSEENVLFMTSTFSSIFFFLLAI